MRLIVWQRLAPSVDGKRVALREYLAFSEELRDELLSHDPDHITSVTRKLVYKYGRPMHLDIEEKFKQKLISDRTYRILSAQCSNENT